ncbi:MAG TPA: response regulator transcription factor [Chloroflexota bacterium]|nr:response regulator transcription factor [Chloroflexota bacterium]
MADILIADDDAPNRALMRFVLETQGGHAVRAADCAATALQELQSAEPDLLVLDVAMPGTSGLELCRDLRRSGALPVLMVSGHGTVDDRVRGLRAGADDYLPKPFDPGELLERVNALLRRSRRFTADPAGAVLRAGRLRLRPIDRQAWVADRGPIALTATECQLLYLLMTRPEHVWPADELLRRLREVSGGAAAARGALESYVARLRAKLETDPRRPRHVVTVRGRGYQLRPLG